MLAKRLIKSNDAGGGACTNTVDLYNPFPDGGGVALYQLNGNANDVSGNHNATTVNAITYGAGQFGQAAIFNGSSSYIQTADSTAFSSQTFTVSAWINTNSNTTTQRFIAAYEDVGTGDRGWWFQILNTGQLSLGYYSGAFQAIVSPNTFPTNTWVQVSVVKTPTTISLYENGVQVASDSAVNVLFGDNNPPFTIGRLGTAAVSYFNGEIDQVRYFNRALRPYEVEALYTEEYCTPTIVPSEHFNTVTYTGNSSTQSITGVGFQPDLVWIKRRNTTEDHALFDSVRGALKMISSNLTAAEYTTAAPYEAVSSFDSDGFTTGDNGATNRSPNDYVAWNFKAGGAAVTNTDGTITSQVSANTEAGFSVVKGTAISNGAFTVGHGLSSAPKLYIIKRTNGVGGWITYVESLGASKYLQLNDTAAAGTSTLFWNNTVPTSTVFSMYASQSIAGGAEFIAYCFAEVEGFSNFGSYVGTGASGNTILTGFEPAMIIVKRSSTFGGWTILDNKRNPQNPKNARLFAEESSAESVATSYNTDFIENGFVINGDGSGINSSGDTFIYMAFAADPTTIEPTLEDSFNTVVYSGDNSTNEITTVGFQPDLVWIKNRDVAYNHRLFDSVRGLSSDGVLFSNLTDAAVDLPSVNDNFISFDNNGFTLGSTSEVNGSNAVGTNNFVAWAWKGAELPAINSNGSIPSVVSANPASGFSIVKVNGNNGNVYTFGHGLDVAPSVVFLKGITFADNWMVYTSTTTANAFLSLNQTAASNTNSTIFNNTEPTDKVFTVGTNSVINNGTNPIIAYCFAEVAGFSKFGSYTGTGASGNTVTVGFEPAFVMIKRTDATGSWQIADNKRNTTNPRTNMLEPNTSNAENPISNGIDFNANDFTLDTTNGSFNGSGGTYIYMAFANQF